MMPDSALRSLKGCRALRMDGAGNEFVMVDLREGGTMTEAAARALGDRRGDFGCDQIIGIMPGPRMAIWNADGSEAAACGNAARCLAHLLMEESGEETASFGSPSGDLSAKRRSAELIEVDMGTPRFRWDEIPLKTEVPDTLALPLPASTLETFGLEPPAGISMGNPHVIFFVEDAEAVDLPRFGPGIEHDPLFPDRANVTAASLLGTDHLRLRTWERGAGITKACGTAACASAVAAHRKGLTGRQVRITADGGTLDIVWDAATNRVLMAGPVALHRDFTL